MFLVRRPCTAVDIARAGCTSFVASAFALEVMIWGYEYRSVLRLRRFVASTDMTDSLQVMVSTRVYAYAYYPRWEDVLKTALCCSDYYTSHPPFDKYSTVSIAAVGTTSLAIQCGEVRF